MKLQETPLKRLLLLPCGLHAMTLAWSSVGSDEMQSARILHWYAYKLRKRVVCQLGLYCFRRCTVPEAQDSVKHRMKFFRALKRSGTSALITVQRFDDSQYMNCLETATPLHLWFRGHASHGGGLPIHITLFPASSTCKEEEEGEQVKWEGEKGRWPGEPSLVICKERCSLWGSEKEEPAGFVLLSSCPWCLFMHNLV